MSTEQFNMMRKELVENVTGAALDWLAYMGTDAALAAIPDTEPPRYVVAGTLANIVKLLPAAEVIMPAKGGITGIKRYSQPEFGYGMNEDDAGEYVRFADVERLLASTAGEQAEPAYEHDLLDIVRSFCSTAQRLTELTPQQREHYPSPLSPMSPLFQAASAACVERGYTEWGLAREGVEYPIATQAAPAAPEQVPAIPAGWKLVAVNPEFDSLMYWMDRAHCNGNLPCDVGASWELFEFVEKDRLAAPIAAAPAAPSLTEHEINALDEAARQLEAEWLAPVTTEALRALARRATQVAAPAAEEVRNQALEDAAMWLDSYDGKGMRRAEAIRAMKRASSTEGGAA